MSWHKHFATLEDFRNDDPSGVSENPPQDQVGAARQAAEHIIASGCIGRDCDFTVSLSGHANAEHKPVEGWANDMIMVTVSQR